MKPWGFQISLLALVVTLITFATIPSHAGAVSSQEQTMYSNETFVRLVTKYLNTDGDKIDYAAWKDSPEDMQALDQQVALLAGIPKNDFPNAHFYSKNSVIYGKNSFSFFVSPFLGVCWTFL